MEYVLAFFGGIIGGFISFLLVTFIGALIKIYKDKS